MSEQAAVLESSPSPVVMEIERGPLVNLTSEERTEFRKTGELPKTQAKPEVEESAPSSEPKPENGEAKPAGDSEPPKAQEKSKAAKPKDQTAEERISQLEATIEKIRKDAGLNKPKADSAPAKPEAVEQQPEFTRPKPKPEGNGPDGKPYETYEDYIDDLTDWKGEQREAKNQREAAQQAQAKEFNSKVNEARSRYENFDDVVEPTALAIRTDAEIPPVIKTLLAESDYLPDFLFTLGSDSAELAKFIKMAHETPGKALRYIALTESLIAEELEGKKTPESEEVPAKVQTKAPRPPSEAGGRAASPPDAELAAVKANDYRAASAEFTRKALAKLKS